MEPLSITILTSGRFHVLDLARELERLGHRVRFLSLLPPWQLPRRGLPANRGVWLLGSAPLLGLRRLARGPLGEAAAELLNRSIDHQAALHLRLGPHVDAFIGMAGMSLHALRAAKTRGALTILERSSAHIELQLALLGQPSNTPAVARELAEYAEVDVLSIPSRHVESGFLAKGFHRERLALNVLGVDLDEFPHDPGPQDGPLEVAFVGAFSRRKGCDLWLEAAARLPTIRFTHVGPPGDVAPASAPDIPNVRHVAAVPQRELRRFYATADVLTLPSREDGFGLVMSQALASGCHVVGTDKTGAPDLAELAPGAVTVVPAGDLEALVSTLVALEAHRAELRAARRITPLWRERLSWRAYAERYVAMIRARLSAGPRRGRATR